MKKFLKRLFVTFFILALLSLALYLFRAPLGRAAANAWIVNDPLEKSDLIVVLGGGPETRPFEAARLYKKGLAPRILVMDAKPFPAQELGLIELDAVVARKVLLKMEVPESNIVTCAEMVESTRDECDAVRHWAATNGIKRIIIATDLFHTRRVRWIFRKELAPAGIEVAVDATPVLNYTATNWWQHEDGLIAFQNEVLKYAYYRIKY